MSIFKRLSSIIATDKATIGTSGEDAAAKYLKAKGMRILQRNWRHGRLELDMVCEDGDTLVFVEVKTRKTQGLTSPMEGIGRQKRSSLISAAKTYLATNKAWQKPCRFDVVGILYNENDLTFTVEYYDNAFDLSTTLGGGNTSWQPW